MAGPEHNPADDHQPTKEEYEAWEREQARDDTGLHQIICPHCQAPVPIPLLRLFEQQQLIFARCDSCGGGITKQQIDDTYREYKEKPNA